MNVAAPPQTPSTDQGAPGVTPGIRGNGSAPKSRSSGGLLTAFTWVVALIFFAPVVWMVLTSFKQESAAASSPPSFFFEPTLDQYRNIFTSDAAPYFLNSVIATGASTVLVLILAVPAAYALSIRPVKRTQDALFFFISTKMLPIVAVIMPIYVIAGQIRMLDNIVTLIILYTAMNLPIAIWMMRSFFLEVPGEVLEAASIDGASLIMTMRRVLIPMVAPGIAATALICVIFAWNEFFFALNLTAANAATAPIYLMSTMTSEGLFLAQLSAASVLASLPVVLAGWIAQKQLVRGLSMGAVK
ncbi:carbohydrate ABC transporter permease [Nesterenkonia muleiensis]|uniref:carbohydrate ABC transporter permease n=1 Tax=Nesterenkonia muleiensis TaxID=2282648 RepID=UPI000E725587|nr:carbohydrate ABC transporter permease [Nesterenkonia muleiensis]